jgi:hypothetical protein
MLSAELQAGAPTSTFTLTRTDTPTFSATPTYTFSATPSPSATPSETALGTFTASPTATITPTWTNLATATFSPTPGGTDVPLNFPVTDGLIRNLLATTQYLYVAGYFQYIGPRTGRGALRQVSNGAAVPGFPDFAGGDVYAVTDDGVGGWYVGGDFLTVAGQPRPYLAHVLGNGSLDPGFLPEPDGTVRALTRWGGDLYAGGSFTVIGGEFAPRLAKLDGGTGDADGAFAPAPDDKVLCLATDGISIFAGGDFTSVGGLSRVSLAKLNRLSGAGDAGFDAQVPGTYQALCSLLLAGGGLYIGGSFSQAGGLTRPYLARLNPATGAGDSSFNAQCNGQVRCLASDGSALYAGGSFSAVGGQSRSYLGKINLSTGAIDGAFSPPSPSSDVYALACDSGWVYAGGAFSSIGSQTRLHVARLVASNGALDAAFNPQANGDVLALAAQGSAIFAGGHFSSMGGLLRKGLARVDRATGTVDASFDVNLNGYARALASDGSSLFVGGEFTMVGASFRNSLAKLGLASGSLDTTFVPGFSSGYGIDSLVWDGSKLIVGGSFGTLSSQSCLGLGRVDGVTGAFDASFQPSPNGSVSALLLSGSRLYVGGSFNSISGLARQSVVALQLPGGVPDPGFNVKLPSSSVRALALTGAGLYVGGDFSSAAGLARRGLLLADALTGSLDTTFDPSPDPAVQALASDGSRVYLAGAFSTVHGQTRRQLAAVDTQSGALAGLDWPLEHGYDPPYCLVLAPGLDQLYVGGGFLDAGSSSASYLAALAVPVPAATLTPTQTPPVPAAPTPTLTPAPGVYSLEDFVVTGDGVQAVLDTGSAIYLAGNFGYVAPRTGAAVLLATSNGAAIAGFPKVAGGSIYTIVPDGSGGWYLGGDFQWVAGQSRKCFAWVRSNMSLDPTLRPAFNGKVTGIVRDGSSLIAAGEFGVVEGQTRAGMARFNAVNGALDSGFNPPSTTYSHLVLVAGALYAVPYSYNGVRKFDAVTGLQDPSFTATTDSGVSVLTATAGGLLVGGGFFNINSVPRVGLARVDYGTGAVDLSFDAVLGGSTNVQILCPSGTSLYIGGSFFNLSGTARHCLAKVALASGALDTAFTADLNSGATAYSLAVDGTDLYAGGYFDTVNAQSRRRLVKLNAASGAVDASFNVSASNPIYNMQDVLALCVGGGSAYVGGDFNGLGGTDRPYLAKVDPATGALDLAFNPPSLDGSVSQLAWDGTYLYASGGFYMVGGTTVRNTVARFNGSTGALDAAWDPNVLPSVGAIALGGGGLYLSGANTVKGVAVADVCKVNLSTGAVVPGFGCVLDDYADSLLSYGTDLYLGGRFTTVNGLSLPYLAKVDAGTGAPDPAFHPNPSAPLGYPTFAMLRDGSRMFVGGKFTSISGQARTNIAEIDPASGLPRAGFTASADNQVLALAWDANRLYAAGTFLNAGGHPRAALAAFDATTGALDLALNAGLDGNLIGVGQRAALAIPPSGGRLILGSKFAWAGAMPAHNVARFKLAPPPGPTATPTVTPTVSPTLTQSATFSQSPTFSSSPTRSVTWTQSPTPSASPTASPSKTPSATSSASPTATPSASASPSRTATPTATATGTRTTTPTASPTPTISPTWTSSPSFTISPTFSLSPTFSSTITPGGYQGASPPPHGQAFVYPSPARGASSHVAYGMAKPGKVTIRVWNEGAGLVDEVRETKPAGSQISELLTGRYAPGVYYYQVKMDYDSGESENSGTLKFTVLR